MKKVFLILSILIIIINGLVFAEALYPTMTLVRDIESSSYLISKGQPKLAYHPINLIDEDPKTAWIEGVEGDGIGEYLTFYFLRAIDIEGMKILNGYAKSNKLFEVNNRIKALELIINRSQRKTILVDDINKEQIINFKAENVRSIKLIIKDIYKAKFDDTALSGIEFLTNIESEKVNGERREEIIKLFNRANFGENFRSNQSTKLYLNDLDNKFKECIAPQIIREVFASEYPPLDGAGNDLRLHNLLRAIKRNPNLIAPVLKVVYDKSDKGLLASESDLEDTYVYTIRMLLDDNLVALPLMKDSGIGYYTTYYNILDLGDTRIVPKFLDKLIETGIWHEFSCDLMPSEILIREKDDYTEQVIKKYLKKKSMSQEVREELRRVLVTD
ncbi:NADase-type glycan-binding domain-containing protein [Orenia marismortui]|uniref:NAD glycohydrolase translocation F5/8 type C domain-containing protein n=1 Tax=Orenia marismortui TaxID=46469 RepID=A0A4R8GFV3_9FIRM|nr:hypothetical protein [Orenia marismortui]TDX44496.1 hypothetical protein C7959_1522 [Orenia marismortui]